jgi:hypothetical protein
MVLAFRKRSLIMTSLKILSAAAAMALVLPLATPSFAQGRLGGGGGAHFSGGGGGAHFSGARMGGAAAVGGGRSFAAAGNWHGGGGNWHGGWGHRGGGFWPGVAAGAAIGALGSYAYYGGGYYDDPYYYGDGYEAPVAVVPDGGGDSAAYCAQRYKSYDPASGTYLGYDGLRHPCP